MRASIILATLSAFALTSGAVAQGTAESVTSVASDAGNPETQYLTETNSNGVVTGQPSVITSQPAAATSQEAAASIPAGLTSPVVTPQTETSGFSTATSTTETGNVSSAANTSSGSSSTGTSSNTESSASTGTSSSGSSASTTASTGGAGFASAGMGVIAGAAILAFL
ncbi:uncharacterized protein N7483_003694 [Penicillium malachiteum]|uniref:uncharacterized protein n=1 Tax=Penicillium malachiteum TaxID=1324776 RepID=UPI0025485718|nr:uncharacterized protein N7483_003694 [Penicillium malachiteum]KAJ5729186.1 hypothetical protein N7483_003694 [Penicillium malachiteum]